MTRSDLLALTPESLSALANRGLVKRAAKDVDAGAGPAVTVEADGTVRGALPDGTEIVLPAGAGLETATCTCAATGTCRHQIALVLAYQRDHEGSAGKGRPAPAAETAAPAGPGAADAGSETGTETGAEAGSGSRAEDAGPEAGSGSGTGGGDSGSGSDEAAPWSPGEIDDEALVQVLGSRVVTAARRTFRAGYTARLRRADAAVELPTCSVRFLVPGELGYAHTDAAATSRGEAIVLAVWAFRAADERGLTADDVRIDVGGEGGRQAADLTETLRLADQVLLDGAMHASAVLGTALQRAGRDLTAQDLHWPAAAVTDLIGQLTAYRDRHAGYRPERLAELITELHARHRAGAGSPRSQVLGTGEKAESRLRRIRLTALGCRIDGTDDERTADVYLAQADAGIVLVLRRHWNETATGHELAGRRVSGSTLRAFATANIVSETATRSAGRVVRLATGRVAKSTVTPLGSSWTDLPAPVLVRDLRRAADELGRMPPRLVRPRVAAELVRVVEVAEVDGIAYHPGDQRLDATISDAAGGTATVSATFSPYAPGALDDLADALARGPSHISGTLRRSHGALVLDPIAVLAAGAVTVPDLAPGTGEGDLEGSAGRRLDPLSAALGAALDACADAAHRGLLHLTPGTRSRLERVAADLAATGLRSAAEQVDGLARALASDDPRRMTDAWTAAQIRLLTTAELR
ncbi:hypothetical protein [Spirillospora sp. NPDC047279]|uniref:hypothetical protein n=1 Tax=Spirillospora sp. NPDC047279 TaxID=3155478 RepID=UPI00340AA821